MSERQAAIHCASVYMAAVEGWFNRAWQQLPGGCDGGEWNYIHDYLAPENSLKIFALGT